MTLTKKELLAAVKLCNDRSMYSGSPATRTSTNLARLRKLRYKSEACILVVLVPEHLPIWIDSEN